MDLVKRADEVLKDVTPGPWETDERDHIEPYQTIRVGPVGNYRVCKVWLDDCAHDYNPEQQANARFIAAARELVPAMRDRIEADAKRIAELEAELASGSFYKEADIDALMNRADAADARVKVLEGALRKIQQEFGDTPNGHLADVIARAALEGEK